MQLGPMIKQRQDLPQVRDATKRGAAALLRFCSAAAAPQTSVARMFLVVIRCFVTDVCFYFLKNCEIDRLMLHFFFLFYFMVGFNFSARFCRKGTNKV